ncbi:hypothetical protein [Rhodovulum viride]|nr:hypothetical protein [Rhodovulum viride]
MPVLAGDVVDAIFTYRFGRPVSDGMASYDFNHTVLAGIGASEGVGYSFADPVFLSNQALGFDPAPAPPPASAALPLGGLAGLGLGRRRRISGARPALALSPAGRPGGACPDRRGNVPFGGGGAPH